MKGIKKWQAVLQVAQVAAATICKATATFRPQSMKHTHTERETEIKAETKHEQPPSN